MFYQESEIKSLLYCAHCSQPYDEYYKPRILPCCNKTICNTCVHLIEKQTKDNIYKCIACNKYEAMPSKRFQVNTLAVKLLEKQPKEVSRGPEADKFKQNLRDLEILVNRLILAMENGEVFITDECKELRRQVQLAKEEKIQELENHCDALFKKIDSYEEICKIKYKEMNEAKQKTNELIKIVNDSIRQQNAYLSQLTIDDYEVMVKTQKVNELRVKIEKEIKNIEKSIFGNHVMKFEAKKTMTDEELIGKLITSRLDLTVII